jgi:hypothetical protein
MKFRITAILAVASVVAAATLYATRAAPPVMRYRAASDYTTVEVLEYFLLANGRVAAEHPALNTPELRLAMPALGGQATVVAESIARCIQSIDATAGPALTAAFNAADAQRLDNALQRMHSATNNWFDSRYKLNDPCPPPPPPPTVQARPMPFKVKGPAVAYYVFFGADFYAVGVTLGATLVVAEAILAFQAAVILELLVPDFISYEFENTPTELDRQNAVAKIVRALRA